MTSRLDTLSKKKQVPYDLFKALVEDKLPDIFSRAQVNKLLDGFVSAQHLSNLEHMTGKPKSYVFGGKSYYRKEDFIAWAKEYYNVTDGTGDRIPEGEEPSNGAG